MAEIKSFTYESVPARVVFGAASVAKLADEVRHFGFKRALDLTTMEVAQDLLTRWKTLAPDKRSRIAAKLLTGRGETLPANVSKRAFDREMHKRLVSLAHASRN